MSIPFLMFSYVDCAVTAKNCVEVIRKHVWPGDFLVNLSVDVSSLALLLLCQEIGALYLDTCIEPWAGTYHNPDLPLEDRTNYALRYDTLSELYASKHTAVLAHGANPRFD